MTRSGSQPKRAVYSVLMGEYEQLTEQHVAESGDVSFFLFTDDPELKSLTWNVVHVEPVFRSDPVRSARAIKILGHPALSDFDELLWIDNNVKLAQDPAVMLDQLLHDVDLAIPLHSYRESVFDEFSAVIREARDDPTRIFEQLMHYSEDFPEVLNAHPLWTGIMAYRPTIDVRAALEVWWQHVLRYSRRDQLSVNLAAAPLAAKSSFFQLDNFSSQWHTWPVARGRNRAARRGGVHHNLQVPLAELRDAEVRARNAHSAHEQILSINTALLLRNTMIADRDQVIIARDAEIRRQVSVIDARDAEIRRQVSVINEMLASRSFRVTKPLRNVSDAVHRLRRR